MRLFNFFYFNFSTSLHRNYWSRVSPHYNYLIRHVALSSTLHDPLSPSRAYLAQQVDRLGRSTSLPWRAGPARLEGVIRKIRQLSDPPPGLACVLFGWRRDEFMV
jgi:hypothetical protein